MGKILIGICEDDKTSADILKGYIGKIVAETMMEFEIHHFFNASEMIEQFEPDILFLDIEMPGMSGIELKNYYIQNNKKVRIVFCTSHIDNMPEAFGENVVGFLNKPLKYQEVKEKLCVALKSYKLENCYISVRTDSGIERINSNDIYYVESYGEYSKVYNEEEKYKLVLDHRLIDFEKILLNHNFIKINKQMIVSLNKIKSIKSFVALINGVELKISRRYKQAVVDNYMVYLNEMCS